MKLKPEELLQNGYVLMDELGHQNLVPFIQTYMKKLTFYSVFYYISNLLLLALVVYLIVVDYSFPEYAFDERFTHLGYGLVLAFALLPVHEYIHVLAYRWQGATNTSYAANLRKLYFMALADKFVANRKEFVLIALAPFVVILLLLVAGIIFTSQLWSITFAGTLLMHTGMCSGDFGLLSYLQFHKHKDVVTYDDVPNGISYFYGKERG